MISLPIKKMEIIEYTGLINAGLCISLPIKVRRFREGFGGSRMAFGRLYAMVRVIEFALE